MESTLENGRVNYRNRSKVRFGMIIGLEEFCRLNMSMVRDFNAELFMDPDYIGYAEIYEGTARVFIFDSKESAEKKTKIARNIGFCTAGMVDGNVFCRNDELERPHLKRMRNHNSFMRELYR